MVVLDAGLVVGLRLEDAAVRVVAQAAAPPQLLLDPEHPVVVLLRLFLGEQTNQSCFMIVGGRKIVNGVDLRSVDAPLSLISANRTIQNLQNTG